jgi:hypothetical protein
VGEVGDAVPQVDLEEATTTAEEIEAAPELEESASDIVDAEVAEAAPAVEEEAAEAAEDIEDIEPVGSEVAVAEPATGAPQKQGVWTEEQAEAFRTRLRDVTAKFVDKTAAAVIDTVNTVAAAIRSRTSSDRDDRRG